GAERSFLSRGMKSKNTWLRCPPSCSSRIRIRQRTSAAAPPRVQPGGSRKRPQRSPLSRGGLEDRGAGNKPRPGYPSRRDLAGDSARRPAADKERETKSSTPWAPCPLGGQAAKSPRRQRPPQTTKAGFAGRPRSPAAALEEGSIEER